MVRWQIGVRARGDRHIVEVEAGSRSRSAVDQGGWSRAAHREPVTAEHRAAVAHVSAEELEVVELGAVHEHEQRCGAVCVRAPPRDAHELAIGEWEGLLDRGAQPLRFRPDSTAAARRRRGPLLVAARDVVGQVLGDVLGGVGASVAIEDAEDGTKLAQPTALDETVLLALLLALPRLGVARQREGNLRLVIEHRLLLVLRARLLVVLADAEGHRRRLCTRRSTLRRRGCLRRLGRLGRLGRVRRGQGLRRSDHPHLPSGRLCAVDGRAGGVHGREVDPSHERLGRALPVDGDVLGQLRVEGVVALVAAVVPQRQIGPVVPHLVGSHVPEGRRVVNVERGVAARRVERHAILLVVLSGCTAALPALLALLTLALLALLAPSLTRRRRLAPLRLGRPLGRPGARRRDDAAELIKLRLAATVAAAAAAAAIVATAIIAAAIVATAIIAAAIIATAVVATVVVPASVATAIVAQVSVAAAIRAVAPVAASAIIKAFVAAWRRRAAATTTAVVVPRTAATPVVVAVVAARRRRRA